MSELRISSLPASPIQRPLREHVAEPMPAPNAAEVPPFEYWATPITPGRTLVEASAGTGKTFAIAGLVLRLVLDPSAGSGQTADPLAGADGLPDLRRLLVVTFTNAATEELKTRIRAALRTALAVARGEAEADDLTRPLAPLLDRDGAEDRLLAALDRVDEAGIFTIHGFCKRVLEQAAFESGTPFDMAFVEDADSDALRWRAAADAWAGLVHGDPLLASLALQYKRTPDALLPHHKAVADFPRVRILPEAPTMEDARAKLLRRMATLAEAWDPAAARAALADVAWNKDAPLDGPGAEAVFARVAAFARGEDPDALALVRHCTPEAIQKAGKKTSKDRKAALEAACAAAAFAACAEVCAAADVLDRTFQRAFVLEVSTRIERIKEHRGQLTFSDLITRLHDALLDADTGPALAAGIRRQFAVALIDEFQDTDPLQYAIFRTAFEGCPLYFVGDPKQAIYAFRGADVHAYLGAQREAGRRYTLGTNWRSTARLVEAVNAVFQTPTRPFLFDGIPFRPVKPSPNRHEPRLIDGDAPPLVWWPMPAGENGRPLGKTAVGEEIPALVAAEIRRLLAEARFRTDDGERELEARDVAVLVPTRYEAAEIQQALQALRIPAVVSRTADVRESAEMAEVELLLRAVLRPDDERALRAALATELWGWSAHRIARLDEAPDDRDDLRRRLREFQRGWRRHGVLGVLAAFQQREGVLPRLLAYPDGERRVTNLRHTAELLHEVEQGNARSPEDLLHWLRHRADQPLPSREMKELRLERDEDAVQITTHHNAKGLEYEVVFLPYLWSISERDFAKQDTVLARTEAGVVYDLGSDAQDAHERLRQLDTLAEHVRKAYVALTRARERCYVVWGPVLHKNKRLDPLSSLGYLLCGHDAPWDDDPAGHVERARRRAAVDDPLAPLTTLDPTGTLMAVRDPLDTDSPTPIDQAGDDGVPGPASTLDEGSVTRVLSPWRAHSFSAWATDRPHDGATLAASDEPDVRRAEAPGGAPTGFHAFAAGTAPGTCLHEVLQYARFHDLDGEAATRHNDAVVHRALERHGLADARRHRAPLDPHAEVRALLDRVAKAPLLGEATLGDCRHRWTEWRFVFPVGRVAPRALAEAFCAHAAPPFDGDYAERLAALSDDAVDGFMTGVADLVAHHGDRWWVLDWKSNALGPNAEAYAGSALAEAMHAHHYGLQLHLYTLGLHRHLRARLGGAYDYERDVGGAVYVFLRGLRDDAPEAGLLRHRPPRALIEALDLLLGGDA